MLAIRPIRSASKAVFHLLYIITFVCSTNVKTLQERLKYAVFHFFTEGMDGLFHKITEWCIKYGAIKTTEKLLQSS